MKPTLVARDRAPAVASAAGPRGAPQAGGAHDEADAGFGRDLRAALRGPSRSISPKYFYDLEGSRLFDRICELPEYYPTRVECGILARCADALAKRAGRQAEIVEFGAGSLRKVRLLLQAFEAPARYLPIDISAEHLHASASTLRHEFEGLDVQPVAADFSRCMALPPALGSGRRIGFFPGSSLGNFAPEEALDFLRRAHGLLQGGALILGVDLVKDPQRLHAAYNDAQGVTAAFNLNLLARANRELGADFDTHQFAHYAFYNAPLRRIEMHLVSRRAQAVALGAERFCLEEGESLHTENSYKFTIEGLRALAAAAGFRPGPVWTDPERLFSVHWLDAS